MAQRYIIFDVETPNFQNDRISGIGITIVEGNRIVQTMDSLVNPEVHFDPFNIRLTGISPEMVVDKPTFPQLWDQIEPVMDSGLLVAHNAAFDMSVLAKCLKAYNISWHPYTYYACTCTMGRQYYPQLENHKLNTICGYLAIPLNHHDAGSDSLACAKILLSYLEEGLDIDRFIRSYDLEKCCTQKTTHKVQLSDTSMSLNTLKSILKEITDDGVLTSNEVLFLENWMEQNAALRGNFPYDKIFDTVESALADGVLEQAELQKMFELFDNVADPVAHSCSCAAFDIAGKSFCLTGEFNYGARSAVEKLLIAKGGIPVKSVTKKTDYVIVGSQGSDAWVGGNYGTKIKKALELQEKGIPIQIVKESDIAL